MSKDNNIIFSLEETSGINNFDINDLLKEIDASEYELDKDQDQLLSQMIHYRENFTIKDLLLICEYYGIAKDLKVQKCVKDIIIQVLTNFESDFENYEIVCKRKNLWFYINELKNDKFMKKYIIQW
jgi:hypothetical protein